MLVTNLMSKARRLLRQPGFHVLCALVIGGLFNWPVIARVFELSTLKTFYFIFSVWVAATALLFLIARSLSTD